MTERRKARKPSPQPDLPCLSGNTCGVIVERPWCRALFRIPCFCDVKKSDEVQCCRDDDSDRAGLAITYGVIPGGEANQIMDHLLAEMKEVGYAPFQYGSPGNLIPVGRDDCVEAQQRWGGSKRADDSDGLQIYENAGASRTLFISRSKRRISWAGARRRMRFCSPCSGHLKREASRGRPQRIIVRPEVLGRKAARLRDLSC
jgi:hypothetical protein